VTSGRGVDILDTREGQDLLGDGSSDNTGTAGSGGALEADGTALTGGFGGNGVDLANLVAPIASANWHEGQLSDDEGALNGDLDLLGKLDAETNVAGVITNNDDGLETGTLASLGLLLDGYDLHNLVTELFIGLFDEFINNGCLLDGDRVSVDFLK
jgi:hypothetical protein